MFEVTCGDIVELSDADLRALVAHLCIAEFKSVRRPSAGVTWGGSQDAADGGIDVRVEHFAAGSEGHFIPRAVTGFQVKKPDLPPKKVCAEMLSHGTLRTSLSELASGHGAYIIVSARASCTDVTLRNRRTAMRSVVDDAGAQALYTDFYDQNRLKDWTNQHPAVALWVKARLGQSASGWCSYGSWSSAGSAQSSMFLCDDKARVRVRSGDGESRTLTDGLHQVREMLARPATSLRLVGLSGVGKTRFAQALFEEGALQGALNPRSVIYTDCEHNPTPEPVEVARRLVNDQACAVLVVDNCGADLHRHLNQEIVRHGSQVSLLTIEHDVRDDQPEGTEVVLLEAGSIDLIERLLDDRYPKLSQVDAHSIANFSGGNSRIAIALADAVEKTGTVANLTDAQLFDRLFYQRHAGDVCLRKVAEVCSLVYSFDVENSTGEVSELAILSSLADVSDSDIYRCVAELQRRGLAQQRGPWRAILPQAVANRLAGLALENFRVPRVEEKLCLTAPDRLTVSFARRLSFLHESRQAQDLVHKWLGPGGILATPSEIGGRLAQVFALVAPVDPEKALAALEGNSDVPGEVRIATAARHIATLRSLAYDSDLFDRSVRLLAAVSLQAGSPTERPEAVQALTSLFYQRLSGTHASIEQRWRIIRDLLADERPEARSLGADLLDAALTTDHFMSSYGFSFGSRPRDFGYFPRTRRECVGWYQYVLQQTQTFAKLQVVASKVARHLRGLWRFHELHDGLESFANAVADGGFWHEGWLACRYTINYDRDRITCDAYERVKALADRLRPTSLSAEIQAHVVGVSSTPAMLDLHQGDDIGAALERARTYARELGDAAASELEVLQSMLPMLCRGGAQIEEFGEGLARACNDRLDIWERIVEAFSVTPSSARCERLLCGYLRGLRALDAPETSLLLQRSLRDERVLHLFPALQAAACPDTHVSERLHKALESGQVSLHAWRAAARPVVSRGLEIDVLRSIVFALTECEEGASIALHILHSAMFPQDEDGVEHDPRIADVAAECIARMPLGEKRGADRLYFQKVAQAALKAPERERDAVALALRIRDAVAAMEAYAFQSQDLLAALLKAHPTAVLDALFSEHGRFEEGIAIFDDWMREDTNAAEALSSEDLLSWCRAAPDARFEIAAQIVPLFDFDRHRDRPTGVSALARELFASAPDQGAVLSYYARRCCPKGAWGSFSEAYQAHVETLVELTESAQSDQLTEIERVIDRLRAEVRRERMADESRARRRMGSFE